MASVTTARSELDSLDGLVDTIVSAVEALKGNSDVTATSRLVSACRSLIMQVSSPTEILKNMALIDKHNLVSLQVINRYRLSQLVPTKGIKIKELADISNLDTNVLTRILRQAMTYGVFCEPRSGFISHTALSLEIPRLAPLLTYQLEVCLPSCMSLVKWLEHPEYRTPFQIAHNTCDSWWRHAEKRPGLIQSYSEYMALITKGGPHDASHVVKGYDWKSMGNALVVDIGGADGVVGVTLAKEFPKLEIIVQDSPSLRQAAEDRIPRELKERVVFIAHSFFEPQIEPDADVFLLRHILHDWGDDECIKILSNLACVMKQSSRLIVAEQVLQEPGTMDESTERLMRALDMQMMVQFGGKERTLDDWKKLFMLINPQLELFNCNKPSGSADSFLELRRRRKRSREVGDVAGASNGLHNAAVNGLSANF